jgi:predicted  nucleic acid-binding Zn-ribbon protein
MNEYWHQTFAELKKQIEDLNEDKLNKHYYWQETVDNLQKQYDAVKKENENLRIDIARLETRAKNSENALKALLEYGT